MPRKATTFEIPYAWVTPKEYSEQTGMWIEDVKRLCNEGKLQCEKSPGGYYRIKVFKNEVIPQEQYESVIKENAELKALVKAMQNIANQVKVS